MSWTDRTEKLLGDGTAARLSEARVLVFGCGGVGSAVCETLARAGVGHIAVVDRDVIDETNLNRQLLAVASAVGMPKTAVQSERIRAINPQCEVLAFQTDADDESIPRIIGEARPDFIADAVDCVSAKLKIIETASAGGIPFISCMGTGNKLDATRLRVSDISKTSVCPLARVMRRELRARGIASARVLWSDEIPAVASRPPASVPWVPPAAGMLIAAEAVKTLCRPRGDKEQK